MGSRSLCWTSFEQKPLGMLSSASFFLFFSALAQFSQLFLACAYSIPAAGFQESNTRCRETQLQLVTFIWLLWSRAVCPLQHLFDFPNEGHL